MSVLKKSSIKKWLIGSHERKSPLSLAVYYSVLVGIGFIYVYPILYMLVNSFMSPADLADPSVSWIPSELFFGNFKKAFAALDFWKSLLNSLIMTVLPMLFQTLVASVVGFGLARYEFPLKKMWIALIVSTFILPSQIMLVPRYALFYDYGIINTVFPSYLPALLGQGIKSAIFILVFFMFFKSYPLTYDEAAEIDGASSLRIYASIAMPMSRSAIVLSMLFSGVWYWNETTQASMYFADAIPTLPVQLSNFTARYEAIFGKDDAVNTVSRLNQATSLAGTLLSILPILILYICLQKQFVESIDRTGIAGE